MKKKNKDNPFIYRSSPGLLAGIFKEAYLDFIETEKEREERLKKQKFKVEIDSKIEGLLK